MSWRDSAFTKPWDNEGCDDSFCVIPVGVLPSLCIKTFISRTERHTMLFFFMCITRAALVQYVNIPFLFPESLQDNYPAVYHCRHASVLAWTQHNICTLSSATL